MEEAAQDRVDWMKRGRGGIRETFGDRDGSNRARMEEAGLDLGLTG